VYPSLFGIVFVGKNNKPTLLCYPFYWTLFCVIIAKILQLSDFLLGIPQNCGFHASLALTMGEIYFSSL